MVRIKPQALLQQSKRKKGPSRISLTTIIMSTLIVVLIVFFVYASYRHWTQRSRIHIENKQSVIEGDNSFMDSKKSDLPGYAILDTSKGSITVELFKDSSPEVVDQFLDLCNQKGRFNGMLFRHVIKHYVIQAGDSDKLGAVEGWTLKGKQYNQLDTSLKHEAFMLGTSKAKHDDKEFEFFITTALISDLNEKLFVFGKVTKGDDIVQVTSKLLFISIEVFVLTIFPVLSRRATRH
ncbi:peptidyl-prolyl cis-trans isomerase CYP21-3, mitochondrial-like [Hibiscus syriacus]|uniref:peptidyl-prolyl cis-trans isomerase CYP21-3, mitochondrial-like n=1 Tax=Hibiscus syriacus TaxID=106335 RepID=UPI0019242950|nr:peptidyl-prolyl cis-trans isomerase CYP21-3, mitochondrial-like [Hibiscus syriacus]